MSDVFISYSRKNSPFARRLIDKLILAGKDAWVDWEGIPLTSPNWWSEIKAGIEGADNFVFILSPDSMASVVCNMELDYAIELNKRIVPVIYQDVETRDAFASIADFTPDEAMEDRLAGKDPLIIARDNWQRLSHINWVFFRDEDDFDAAFETLVTTVETDLEYVKAHTRYLVRAQEWERENQRADLLLFGGEIDRAETWLTKAESYVVSAAETSKAEKPSVVNSLPKDLHREYIRISRQADRRRRRLVLSAQLSIVVLVIVLIAGILIGSSIVTQTQQQAADIEATSAQNVALAATQVADANEQLTAVPPTLTQINEQVIIAQGQADTAATQAAVAVTAVAAVNQQLESSEAELQALENRAEGVRNSIVNLLARNLPDNNLDLLYTVLAEFMQINPDYCIRRDDPDLTARLAQAVLSTADPLCGGIDRNEICYVGGNIEVGFRENPSEKIRLSEPGQIISLAEISSMSFIPSERFNSSQGVALARLQANLIDTLPGQSTFILLLGSVEGVPMMPIHLVRTVNEYEFYQLPGDNCTTLLLIHDLSNSLVVEINLDRLIAHDGN